MKFESSQLRDAIYYTISYIHHNIQGLFNNLASSTEEENSRKIHINMFHSLHNQYLLQANIKTNKLF